MKIRVFVKDYVYALNALHGNKGVLDILKEELVFEDLEIIGSVDAYKQWILKHGVTVGGFWYPPHQIMSIGSADGAI